ncbi:hypothetical protein LA080_002180 [Diaporthe eres]|nr:hypothetical protein LA080_002180 [Diaporthe eres]
MEPGLQPVLATPMGSHGCSATHVGPAEALRRRHGGALFYAPMRERTRERCFSITGATILSGIRPAFVPACVPACHCHYCKKGGCWPGCSAQARRRFGPPSGVGARPFCTLLRGTPVGDRQARRNRKQLRDVRATRRKTANELAINLVPNPTAWLAEPWLRVMSRKVFCSETDASGMS